MMMLMNRMRIMMMRTVTGDGLMVITMTTRILTTIPNDAQNSNKLHCLYTRGTRSEVDFREPQRLHTTCSNASEIVVRHGG